ncbi:MULTISPECIES: hypothetical protein [Oceanobacillus]|uniref:Lipoprotein n=1 Tax=Oceanobacillus kimchii TaxID=746691 RepID=A0ABQ5TNH3_9BACI|nr:hypothetical protein [Oceanobacillus kimchii]GLO68361.1 hypothetical protein MACH08_41450 [Oceanobacillus kimchii]
MNWKYRLLVSILFSFFLITACSSAEETVIVVDEETGEEIEVSKELVDKQDQEKNSYSEHLTNTFDTSIGLHDSFAHALDDMFTKESSEGQFAKILKDNVIEQSREVLDAAEKYNFPSEFFEMNQLVVQNLNNQHQLFLDAVNEATISSESENKEIDIVKLRERLATIKQDYLTIVNTWKNGGKVEK